MDCAEEIKTVRINPFIGTLISEGYCSIYTESNSQLVTLENVEGDELLKTYANKRTYINYNCPVYARSNSTMLDVEVRDLHQNILIDDTTGYENIKDAIDEAISKVHVDTNFEAYYILSKG